MKSLQDQYSWIDPDRTAIWGWSYGGYATLMTLIQDTNNVFKCGKSMDFCSYVIQPTAIKLYCH